MENTKREIENKKYHLSELIKLYEDKGLQIPIGFSEEEKKLDMQWKDCKSKLEKEGTFLILEEIKNKISKLKNLDKKEERKIKKWNVLLKNLILYHKDRKEIKQILRGNTGFAVACFSIRLDRIKIELELDCRGSLKVLDDCVLIEIGEIKKDTKNMKKARNQLENILLILKDVASVLYPHKNIKLIGHIFYTGEKFSEDEFVNTEKGIEYKYQKV